MIVRRCRRGSYAELCAEDEQDESRIREITNDTAGEAIEILSCSGCPVDDICSSNPENSMGED